MARFAFISSVLILIVASSVMAAEPQQARVSQVAPMPDLLETTPMSAASKAAWRQVSRFMWDWLLTNDHDFHDSNGNVVAATSPNIASAASGSAVQCGRFSRLWTRLAFHDCGTYSRFLRTFGCNGSVRKELPHTDPWLDYTQLNPDGKSFVVLSPDVFDQFKANGVLNPAIDVEYNTLHQENGGMAAAVAALYRAKLYANSAAVGLWDASFADVLVLGSLLAMARCEGPHVRFVPGRGDTNVADEADQLPNFQDNFHHTLFYFLSNGLSELDGIALIGGSHSTACFQAGCLDATPSRTDKLWASQVLSWDGVSPPLCTSAATTSVMCMAPSDTLWLQHEQSKAYLRLMLSTATNMDVFEHEVGLLLEKLGVTNYGGLLPSANLCGTTLRTCPGFAENFAYHTLVASAMFRLVSLRPVTL